jgi:hypothetical protein
MTASVTDRMGLVWFVKGGRIVSISMSAAVIETVPATVRRPLCFARMP